MLIIHHIQYRTRLPFPLIISSSFQSIHWMMIQFLCQLEKINKPGVFGWSLFWNMRMIKWYFIHPESYLLAVATPESVVEVGSHWLKACFGSALRWKWFHFCFLFCRPSRVEDMRHTRTEGRAKWLSRSHSLHFLIIFDIDRPTRMTIHLIVKAGRRSEYKTNWLPLQWESVPMGGLFRLRQLLPVVCCMLYYYFCPVLFCFSALRVPAYSVFRSLGNNPSCNLVLPISCALLCDTGTKFQGFGTYLIEDRDEQRRTREAR